MMRNCEECIHKDTKPEEQPCAFCTYEDKDRWIPEGCLRVTDEKVGVGRFRGPGWVRSVTEKEDRAIFDSIAVAGCPEGCLMVFDENGKV